MGVVSRSSPHRLPVDLPHNRSVEEVLLARKLSVPYLQRYNSNSSSGAASEEKRHESCRRRPDRQRSMLAAPISPANFLVQLPPETDVRNASRRLGKCPRSCTVGHAARLVQNRRDRTHPGRLTPPELRPLTGVSPPSTAQSSFNSADFDAPGLYTTQSGFKTPPSRGIRGLAQRQGSDIGVDTNAHEDCVSFLTDKCNALATRLQLVETQLLQERTNSKEAPHPTSSQVEDSGSAASVSARPETSPAIVVEPQRQRNSEGAHRPSLDSNQATGRDGHTIDTSGHDEPAGGDGLASVQGGRSRFGGMRADADVQHCEMVEQQIAERFEVVTGGMDKLENIFSGAAQILERRVRAITTISSAIRMFLQRCRYLRAQDALKLWRIDHSLPVLQCLRGEMLRQEKIEAGLRSLESRHDTSTAAKIFRFWSRVIGTNEQRKHILKMFEERVRRRQEFDLVQHVFLELKNQTIGPSSSRELARLGRVRMEEARQVLADRAAFRGEQGLLVTRAMIRQEMSRKAIEVMRRKIESNVSRLAIMRLKRAVEVRRIREAISRAHYKRGVSRRVMRGWSKWAALKANGQDRKLMTGYKAGLGIRYNPNTVAAFSRRREMTSVFRAWAEKSAQLAMASRKQRAKLTEVALGAFDKWKVETRKSKQVKKIAVGMWADHSLKELGEPLRMWYIFTQLSKRQTTEQERLLKLHQRAKNRKKCHVIIKAWKHLAVYGRVEGLYTRSQLMASLAEQKEHTLRLVDKVDELAGGLGDMEALAMEYRSQMIVRQRETREREAGMDRQTMALHHAEQEIVRLQSLLNVAAEVAPAIAGAVQKAAPDFDFQNRGMLPLAMARTEAAKLEEDLRIESIVAKRMAEQRIGPSTPAGAAGRGSGAGAGSETRAEDEGSDRESNSTQRTASSSESAEQGMLKTRSGGRTSVHTADAQTQAKLPPDAEAEARAAVAVQALASGVTPPLLPRELARLDRVEWVLRRTSFAAIIAQVWRRVEQEQKNDETYGGDKHQGDDGSRVADTAQMQFPGVGTAATAGDGQQDPLEDVTHRLAALFEFLREGNPRLLPPDLRLTWESRPDLGLGMLSADDHSYDARRHARLLQSDSGGRHRDVDAKVSERRAVGNGGGGHDGGDSGGSRGLEVSSWKRLCREARAGTGEPMTYHDLRMALTSTAPRGRRTETVDDKLERRLVNGRARAEEMTAAMAGNERAALAENLYVRSLS